MKKFLIVTADDFGLHEAVNEAVQQASAAGVLTAASLMGGGTRRRRRDSACARAAELARGVCISFSRTATQC